MANESETQIIGLPKSESTLFGVSIRGILVLLLVFTICTHMLAVLFTVCYVCMANKDLSLLGSQTSITEPFYTLIISATAFYFGNRSAK